MGLLVTKLGGSQDSPVVPDAALRQAKLLSSDQPTPSSMGFSGCERGWDTAEGFQRGGGGATRPPCSRTGRPPVSTLDPSDRHRAHNGCACWEEEVQGLGV